MGANIGGMPLPKPVTETSVTSRIKEFEALQTSLKTIPTEVQGRTEGRTVRQSIPISHAKTEGNTLKQKPLPPIPEKTTPHKAELAQIPTTVQQRLAVLTARAQVFAAPARSPRPLPPTPLRKSSLESESKPRSTSAPSTTSAPDLSTVRGRSASAPQSMTPEQRRERVFKEIASSEASYQQNLTRATTELHHMKEIMGSKNPFLDGMIGSYNKLRGLSAKLADKFQKASTPAEFKAIYDSKEFKEYAHVSKQITVNYDKLLALQEKFFSKFSKTLQKNPIFNPKGSDLKSMNNENLITAMQRLPRHELLLRDLLATMKEGSSDHKEISDALAMVKERNSAINQGLKN